MSDPLEDALRSALRDVPVPGAAPGLEDAVVGRVRRYRRRRNGGVLAGAAAALVIVLGVPWNDLSVMTRRDVVAYPTTVASTHLVPAGVPGAMGQWPDSGRELDAAYAVTSAKSDTAELRVRERRTDLDPATVATSVLRAGRGYLVVGSGPDGTVLHHVDDAGSPATLDTAPQATTYAVSPDGTRYAAVTAPQDGKAGRIEVYPATGGPRTSSAAVPADVIVPARLSWTSQGLLVTRPTPTGLREAVLLDPPTGEARMVGATTGAAFALPGNPDVLLLLGIDNPDARTYQVRAQAFSLTSGNPVGGALLIDVPATDAGRQEMLDAQVNPEGTRLLMGANVFFLDQSGTTVTLPFAPVPATADVAGTPAATWLDGGRLAFVGDAGEGPTVGVCAIASAPARCERVSVPEASGAPVIAS